MNGYKAGVEEAGGTFLSDEVQYADATADRATTAMEAIMQTHPEGIAIICANNDDMAMAAARAAQGHDAYKNTIFLGFNGDRAACEAILDGQMTMSVAQMAYEMGYKAVETMVLVLDGETVDEFVDSGSDVVTPDNAQERLSGSAGKRSNVLPIRYGYNANFKDPFSHSISLYGGAPCSCPSRIRGHCYGMKLDEIYKISNSVQIIL